MNTEDKRCADAGLIWVSHRKDAEWFMYSAKSYAKFARGFRGAVCVVPIQDTLQFEPICSENHIQVLGVEEWKDKPFLWHMMIKCIADKILRNCGRIFHMDSDAVFAQPVTPADWCVGDKILLPYTPYDAFLKRPIIEGEMESFMGLTGRKVDFSLGQYNWRFAVEFALGHRVERECMAWMPIVHHYEVYAKMRELLDTRFPEIKWDGHVRSGPNCHPQTFAEFNTLGAVAHKYFEDLYEWYNLEGRPYPFYGKVIQSWSHGGMDKKFDYGDQIKDKTIDTPRKLFRHLGL